MATKKGSKSSKTAHVLNLITGSPSQEEEPAGLPPETPDAPPQEPGQGTVTQPQGEDATHQVPEAPAAPHRLVPPILEEVANEEALSEQIRSALEAEISGVAPAPAEHTSEAEPAPVTEPAPVPEPLPVPAPEPLPEPAPVQEPVPVPEPMPTPEPIPVPEPEPLPASEPMPIPEPVPEPVPAPVPEPIPVPEPEPAHIPEPAPVPVPESMPASESVPMPDVFSSVTPLEDDFAYVNVMQALIEEKTKRYMDLFGLCKCSRCVADVKALALTNLPALYLVMPKGSVIPTLTVYEGRYSSTITAQIMRACKVVMENPRHTPS